MKFHKRAAPQDDSVAEATNFAPYSLLKRRFALLLLDNLLRIGGINRRWIFLRLLPAFQIQEPAIRFIDLLSTRGLRQA